MTMIDYKYVVGTVEECDVNERAVSALSSYIRENELMDDIIMFAADEMRDWFMWEANDAIGDAVDNAVKKVTGRSIAEWEEEEG